MKKTLLAAIIIFGTFTASVCSASLFNFYGGNLPSVNDRKPLAEGCGISDYTGTKLQNIKLEECLSATDVGEMLGAATVLMPQQGGTGINSSALTGFAYVSSGVWSASSTISNGSLSAAGLTGGVQFNDAGKFAATSALFWDNTNFRLGIGTNAPTNQLEISSTSTSELLKLTQTGAGKQSNINFSTVGGTGTFQLDQAGNMVFYTNQGGLFFDNRGAGGSTYFRTGGTNIRMQIDNAGNLAVNTNQLYVQQSTGKVGIGTSTLTEALNVIGNVGLQNGGYYGIRRSSGNAMIDVLSIPTGTDIVTFKSAHSITGALAFNLVNTGNTSMLAATGDGKVNIGLGATSYPYNNALTVLGDLGVTGTIRVGASMSSGTYGQLLMSSGTSSAWVSTSTLGITGIAAGLTGGVQFNNAGNFAATSALFWDNTNFKLGINKPAPVSTLDVVGNGYFTTGLTLSGGFLSTPEIRLSGASYARIGVNSGDGSPFMGYNMKYDSGYKHDSNGTLSGIAYNALGLHFYGGSNQVAGTTAVEQLTMLTNGNLGIGITTPLNKLSVNGRAEILGGYGLSFSSFGNTDYRTAEINSIYEGATYKGSLAFYTHPSSAGTTTPLERMRIDSLGNVGIGTTTSIYKLTIAGDLGVTGTIRVGASMSSGTYGQLLMSSGTSSQWVSTSTLGLATLPAGSTGQVQFNDGGIFGASASLFWDKVKGWLGIGTSAPTSFVSLQTATTSAFSISSSTGQNLLEAKNYSIKFGMGVDTGSFISYNSYFGEEFTRERTAITADTAFAWGDYQQFGVDENATCTWNTQDDTVNGIGDQTAAANSACLAFHASAVNNAHLQFNANNLPLILIKARPALFTSTSKSWLGISDVATATSSEAAISNAIYFAPNENTGLWDATTKRAGVTTTISCTGQAVSTTMFALLKTEVISSDGSGGGLVNFYIDTNTTDGIQFTKCGESTTNIPTANLTSMIMSWSVPGFNLYVDYYKIWQY